MLKKEFIFTISLLGTTIQDGGINKRSNGASHSLLKKNKIKSSPLFTTLT